jgi:nucleoside-diphosphate-sugar epimerase
MQLINKLSEDYLKEINLNKKIKEFYSGKVILVTGGAGAIGSNLVAVLSKIAKDSLIIVMDNLSANKAKDPFNLISENNVLFVNGDIRSNEDLKRVFREKPKIIFHLAAFFANQNSVDYPEESAKVDINGIIKLLDLSIFTNVEKFIYASSGCSIYGSYNKMPLEESFISMNLTTPYQINKMSGEMYCNFYHHHYNLKVVKCRFFNSYGPGEVPGQYRNVIPNFIYWSIKKNFIPITGSGKETRDFTYVLDLVQGLIKAGYYKEAVGKSFNLASGKEIRIIDMKNKIDKILKQKTKIIYKKKRKWDTKPRLLASIKLAKKLIDYKPIYDFERGLGDNIDWFLENWDNIKLHANFNPGKSSAVK